MRDGQADLRMLYMAYSSQIEFSKTQLWRAVNYGIWAIAAIMGLFEGFGADSRWSVAFPCMIIGVCIICLYNMSKNWNSIKAARGKYKEIRKCLSYTFQELVEYKENYDKFWYDGWIVIPLMLVMAVGSSLAWVLQIRKLGVCSWRQFREFWPLRSSAQWACLSSIIVFVVLCILLYLHYHKAWEERKNEKVKQELRGIVEGKKRNRQGKSQRRKRRK